MPSYPCPQCNVKFASVKNRDTHVHYIHSGSTSTPASAPPGGGGFLATVKAARQQEEGMPDDGAGGIESIPPRREAQPALWDDSYAPPPSEMAGMMGSFPVQRGELKTASNTPVVGQEARGTGGKTVPEPSGVKTFTVIFEGTAQDASASMKVPHNEQFDDFIERMRQASIPIAGEYISGRITGFTLEDGPWRYVLVDKKRMRGVKNELTSKLLYLAMVSELVKAWTPWDHVVIWHEKQKAVTSVPVSEPAMAQAPVQFPGQLPTQSTNLPGPISTVVARQAVAILDSKNEYSTTRYLVLWMDGPKTWELASVLEDEYQWLINAYHSEVNRGTH